MLANGWRTRNRPGAHETVAAYGAAELASHAGVREFNRMRRMRNRVEYGVSIEIGEDRLRADLARARAIVACVEAEWPGRDP